MNIDWGAQLRGQLEWHWNAQLRPRLAGLTDEEYFWEPVPGCWNVRRRAPGTEDSAPGSGEFTVDFAWPPPEPPPVTTIAWRMAHIIIGVFGMRTAAHFGGPAMDYQTFEYAGGADHALAQLDDAYERWSAGVHGMDAAAFATACGPAEGPWAEHPMAELVLHINREVLHHGAEIALLRDLFRHRDG